MKHRTHCLSEEELVESYVDHGCGQSDLLSFDCAYSHNYKFILVCNCGHKFTCPIEICHFEDSDEWDAFMRSIFDRISERANSGPGVR